ncbi:hypothetical protein SLS56_007498 [Neofusicoccum ribis]|uniref:Uncharacterized protein n=1 Tax=Neofusicoccum ribis TaxID=45134 RepID=A0ABR3SNE5_9PEZI
MRRDTSDHTLSQDGRGASPAPDVIDSIDSILAEHDGVLHNVIEQLQTCARRLQKIRSLSQQFGPKERDRSASQLVETRQSDSGSNLAPGSTAAEVSTTALAATSTANDPPALQTKRTRSIPDLIRLVDDAGEKFGLNLKQTEDQNLKEMTKELHRADDVHELDAAAAEMEPISPTLWRTTVADVWRKATPELSVLQ